MAIPVDHLAFQIGETAQIHTGGLLQVQYVYTAIAIGYTVVPYGLPTARLTATLSIQATPHAVRGTCVEGVTRDTFAVFMEPNYDEPMHYPVERSDELTQSQSAIVNLPKGVSPIRQRWNNEMNFAQFTAATLGSYF